MKFILSILLVTLLSNSYGIQIKNGKGGEAKSPIRQGNLAVPNGDGSPLRLQRQVGTKADQRLSLIDIHNPNYNEEPDLNMVNLGFDARLEKRAQNIAQKQAAGQSVKRYPQKIDLNKVAVANYLHSNPHMRDNFDDQAIADMF